MSNEIWRVVVDGSVRKMLNKIPLADAEAITVALAGLAANPFAGDIQKLRGEDAWRRRIRSYRVEFRVYQDKRVVLVYKLKRRTSTTYR
jgi:mRNA-degrading endonuclease RelE of RelBE toxin-antitoxin system